MISCMPSVVTKRQFAQGQQKSPFLGVRQQPLLCSCVQRARTMRETEVDTARRRPRHAICKLQKDQVHSQTWNDSEWVGSVALVWCPLDNRSVTEVEMGPFIRAGHGREEWGEKWKQLRDGGPTLVPHVHPNPSHCTRVELAKGSPEDSGGMWHGSVWGAARELSLCCLRCAGCVVACAAFPAGAPARAPLRQLHCVS